MSRLFCAGSSQPTQVLLRPSVDVIRAPTRPPSVPGSYSPSIGAMDWDPVQAVLAPQHCAKSPKLLYRQPRSRSRSRRFGVFVLLCRVDGAGVAVGGDWTCPGSSWTLSVLWKHGNWLLVYQHTPLSSIGANETLGLEGVTCYGWRWALCRVGAAQGAIGSGAASWPRSPGASVPAHTRVWDRLGRHQEHCKMTIVV